MAKFFAFQTCVIVLIIHTACSNSANQCYTLTPPPLRLVTATCTNNVELIKTSPVFDRSRMCRKPT